jgi:hypothetical protein
VHSRLDRDDGPSVYRRCSAVERATLPSLEH